MSQKLNTRKQRGETSDLCVALFNGMGAVVSLQDLDVAHRVPRRDQDVGPKPIICKFIRRLAKSEVMNRQRDACKVDPSGLGFSEDVSLGAVRIFDHLSPHSRSQRPRSFWSAPRIATSGLLQFSVRDSRTSDLSAQSQVFIKW